MSSGQGWLLAIDTATSRVVVAAGTPAGEVLGERSFPAEQRHGERLLAKVEALVRDEGLDLVDLEAVIVGLGPGAFTGLRVGLATAKTIAHELGIPIVGISTAEALIDSAARVAGDRAELTLVLPAGPHDRVVVRPGERPELRPGGVGDDGDEGTVAVDLPGRAPEAALARGEAAVARLAAELLRAGAARLAAGVGPAAANGAAGADDVSALVPEYVTLPRGALEPAAGEGGMAWSHDRR